MNTSVTANPVLTQQNPIPSARQPDAPPSGMPFNHVLSREMAGRDDVNEAHQAGPDDAGTPNTVTPASAKAVKKTSEKETAGDNGETAATDIPASPASAATDMLALINTIGQLASTGADKRPDAATAKTEAIPLAIDAARSPATDQDGLPAGLGKQELTTDAKTAAEDFLPVADAKAEAKDAPLVPDSRSPRPPIIASAPPTVETRSLTPDKDAPNAKTVSSNGQAPDRDLQGISARRQKSDLTAASKSTSEQQPPASLDRQEKLLNGDPALSARVGFAASLDAERAKEAPSPSTSAISPPIPQAVLNGAQALAGQVTEKLTPRVGSPAWDQALGQKVVWMVAGDQQSASLTLNPPDLGPLQVVLNVSNGHADAAFFAAQPEARQAIEAAMPKLREMLGDAGIQLGQTSVGAGTPGHNSEAGSQYNRTFHAASLNGGSMDTPVQMIESRPTSGAQGLVDTFV